MTEKTNKLSRFWQELRRRRVVHVITVYASAAFVVIELVNNLSEPLHLPPKLATILIIVLAIGFPFAVILSWIYDLTSEGIERTPSIEEEREDKKSSVPNAWKIATYVSFAVIVGLLTLNIVGGTKQLRAGDIQSLVVLPFDNFTGDDQLENMVSSMHSLLIGDMGRISGLRVIGKTSSNTFKGAQMSAPEIASELGVDAVVEATVTCLGDSICMQFRLISTSREEEQLWVADYREDKGQILNLYNRVTKLIAEEVRIELTDSEKSILTKDRQSSREAIDNYLRSYAYWGDLSPEAFEKALEFLKSAKEKDPDWAPIYAGLAQVWAGKLQMGLVENELGRKLINENINRALELDPDFTDSHFITGILSTWTDWNWVKGEEAFLLALANNPNHVMARIYYAHLLMILQRNSEALVQGKLAVELDPMNPLILALYSTVLKGSGQHDRVLEYLEEALSLDPDNRFARGQLGRAYYNLGEYEKDIEVAKNYLLFSVGEAAKNSVDSIFKLEGHLAAYQEIARLWDKHAKQNYISPLSLSRNYHRIGEYDKTLDNLEKGLEEHNPNMPYIGTGARFEGLHDHPRFLAILDSMNLPHPVPG